MAVLLWLMPQNASDGDDQGDGDDSGDDACDGCAPLKAPGRQAGTCSTKAMGWLELWPSAMDLRKPRTACTTNLAELA
jgi:hypothetical protein